MANSAKSAKGRTRLFSSCFMILPPEDYRFCERAKLRLKTIQLICLWARPQTACANLLLLRRAIRNSRRTESSRVLPSQLFIIKVIELRFQNKRGPPDECHSGGAVRKVSLEHFDFSLFSVDGYFVNAA